MQNLPRDLRRRIAMLGVLLDVDEVQVIERGVRLLENSMPGPTRRFVENFKKREAALEEVEGLTYDQVARLCGMDNHTVAKYVYARILQRGPKIGSRPTVTKKSAEEFARKNGRERPEEG